MNFPVLTVTVYRDTFEPARQIDYYVSDEKHNMQIDYYVSDEKYNTQSQQKGLILLGCLS